MIKKYEDMSVEILQSSDNPAAQVGIACAITQKQDLDIPEPATFQLCQALLDAEHTSVFEHVYYTFLIQDISRSLLAQVTRQRHASPTSGSQHYQKYQNYPCMIHPDIHSNALKSSTVDRTAVQSIAETALTDSVKAYTTLGVLNVPREEARQVLPNACAVNLLWTINARSLIVFLRQRTCNRNVYEMRIFANRVLSLVTEHFPELFQHIGPQCFMDAHFSRDNGGCRQGKMQCKNKFWRIIT